MTLYYSLVRLPSFSCSSILFASMVSGNTLRLLNFHTLYTCLPSDQTLIHYSPIGLRPSRVRDGALHEPHRANALHMEAEAVHFHLGEPTGSSDSIWDEGINKKPCVMPWLQLIDDCSDNLHLHSHTLHRQRQQSLPRPDRACCHWQRD